MPGPWQGDYQPQPQPQPTEPGWSADNMAKGYGGFWNSDPRGAKIMNFIDSDGDGRDDRYQFGPGQGGFDGDAWQANWDAQQPQATRPGRVPRGQPPPPPGGTKTGRDGIPIWTGGEAPRFDQAVPMPGPDWHQGVPGYDQANEQYFRDYEAHKRHQAEYQTQRDAFNTRMRDWENTRAQRVQPIGPFNPNSRSSQDFQRQYQEFMRSQLENQGFGNRGGFPGFNQRHMYALQQPYSRTHQQPRIPMWMQSNQRMLF